MSKKKKTLQEQTKEELQKKKKGLNTVIGMMIGMAVVFLGLIIFYTIKGEWSTAKLPAVSSPIMLSLLIVVLRKQVKSIDEELASRET
ncbi:MAG: hypothetical protein AAF824_06700 [Bacteroidota bacterium]